MEYRRFVIGLALLLLNIVATPIVVATPVLDKSPWYQQGEDGQQELNLYFFWSARCPHCLKAKPVIEQLPEELPWLRLHSREVSQDMEARGEYMAMAQLFGEKARSVPGFFYCGKMQVGFDSAEGMGAQIRRDLEQCHKDLLAGHPPSIEIKGEDIAIPVFGQIDARAHSLPFLTIVIAALDAFNPCAFFVLLFLLSLLIHTRSRRRMLFIGGVFILFSAAVYFLFMSAWLNLFLITGMQRLFTAAAGTVAMVLALINIKDFFMPGRGITLSIAEEKKPGLFQRMRSLLQADNMVALTIGTMTLAIAANSYELLCTSGLPMVYTRVLTMASLSTGSYYLYLLFYNLIYVLPLLLILLLFTFTLGQRKLQLNEGRLLKLLSGIMMLELGLGLLLLPELLSSLSVVAAGMFSAILLTVAAWLGLRMQRSSVGKSNESSK